MLTLVRKEMGGLDGRLTCSVFLSVFILCISNFITLTQGTGSPVPPDYARQRQALLDAERTMQLGGNGSNLTPQEQKVNAVLVGEKRAMVEAARTQGSYFPPAYNFMTARQALENSTAFNIIKLMPKGGALHNHDTSLTSIEWLVKNATYRDHCYMCVDASHSVKFHFYLSPPQDADCQWRLVQDFRKESADPIQFDKLLQSNMSLVVPNPEQAYPDIDTVWRKFQQYFGTVGGLVSHAPVFRDYLYEGLRQFRLDNVQYLEIRALLLPLYELDGSSHGAEWVLSLYKNVTMQFVKDFPDFFGAKVINSGSRSQRESAILSDVKQAMAMHAKDPTFMVGYDLVGQEDRGHSLLYYIDDLLYPSRQNPPVNLPYFFHAGETDWEGTATDDNLVDALLLNTTRVGHGYALYKHPVILAKMRERNIAVEVNPISNQVLKLVSDMRNHPAAGLIATDFPVVISSDDPAVWEARPLTDDFFMTFMALTGEGAGLATLKQLVLNSFKYSAMTDEEKTTAVKLWQSKWDQFINNVVSELEQNAPHQQPTFRVVS